MNNKMQALEIKSKDQTIQILHLEKELAELSKTRDLELTSLTTLKNDLTSANSNLHSALLAKDATIDFLNFQLAQLQEKFNLEERNRIELSKILNRQTTAKIHEQKKCKKELVCFHCSQIFKYPMRLNCGHSFCKTCLKDLNRRCKICEEIIIKSEHDKEMQDKVNEYLDFELRDEEIVHVVIVDPNGEKTEV